MLQLTDSETDARVWINPAQVAAIIHAKQSTDTGCTLLMAGGFEIRVQQTIDDVSAQINKRLSAY